MAKKPKKAAARLETPTDISGNAVPEIAQALNGLVADSYALYTKTKNFHWHVSGPHFRDYHLLFDDQAAEIFATIDDLAERVRKLGARTVHSIGEIAKLQTIKDNNKEFRQSARHAARADGRQQDRDQGDARGARNRRQA
jgi:starvation-inducible DNA-binding protein